VALNGRTSALLAAVLHFNGSDLADEYDVSRSAANRAQKLLAGRGLIRQHGNSCFAVANASNG